MMKDSADRLYLAWDAFVANHSSGNVLQTSGWGSLKARFGWDYEIISLNEDGQIKAGALILYKSLPLKLGTVAYVPRGPVMNWSDPETAHAVLDLVVAAARRNRAWSLWVEPELFDTDETNEVMRGLGLNSSIQPIQPRRTILVDIGASEDIILARMKSKTRYNIGLAARKGVTIREGSLDDVGAFHQLLSETALRNGFSVHDESYYRTALSVFAHQHTSCEAMPPENGASLLDPHACVHLLLAECQGELVAGLMLFALGKRAWYLYGASSDRHRNLMASYATQLAAIKKAKDCGATTYDMWGIPDADEEVLEAAFDQRDDGLWGVYRFKRGFGGEVVRYVGAREMVLNPLYTVARKIRVLGNREA